MSRPIKLITWYVDIMSLTYSLLIILSIVVSKRVTAFHNNFSETVKIRQRGDSSINWFLRHTPLFDLTKIDNISDTCRRDFETFLDGIENLELWALKSERLLSVHEVKVKTSWNWIYLFQI